MKKFLEDLSKLVIVAVVSISLLGWPMMLPLAANPTSNQPIYTIALTAGIPATVTDTTLTIIFTDAGSGSIIKGINVYSTDSAPQTVTLFYYSHATSTAYPVVLTQIPTGAGSLTGTPPVNLMSSGIFVAMPKDGNGNQSWQIGPEDSIKVQMTAVTSTKAFTFVVLNGEQF